MQSQSSRSGVDLAQCTLSNCVAPIPSALPVLLPAPRRTVTLISAPQQQSTGRAHSQHPASRRHSMTTISSIAEIIADLRAGKMVILVDDEDRENEGDLLMAAEFVTPEAINFMAKYGRGLICLALTPEKCDELGLPMMVSDNTSPFGTGFTVSIDAREGVT